MTGLMDTEVQYIHPEAEAEWSRTHDAERAARAAYDAAYDHARTLGPWYLLPTPEQHTLFQAYAVWRSAHARIYTHLQELVGRGWVALAAAK